MTPYTVPIKPTTPVVDLMQQTQTTPRPLFLTVEGGTAPVVVMMKLDAYEKNQRQQYLLYQLQITQLQQWLDRVEQQWEDVATRRACIMTWRNSMEPLWDVAPEPVRELCAALALAVKELRAESLSHDQVAALRYCFALLRDSDAPETAKEEAHQRLMKSGIPPLLSFDDNSLAQLYLDEL